MLGNCPRRVAVSEPLSPELEARAQELAARLHARSADAILHMARTLVATTDETLFGDTEFALRDQALGLVAEAYAEHLPKKTGTTPPPSTAPTVADAPPSTPPARRRSRRSAGPSPVTARTTTAAGADTAPARGTPASG